MVDEDIMTFNVPVDNSQCVHVQEHPCRVQSNLHSLRHSQLKLVLFHVQQLEEGALGDVFEDNHNVGDLGHHTHQQCDVWVP